MKRISERLIAMLIGAIIATPLISLAQDWFEATGVPAQRSAVSSAEIRSEFASIETDIADKLPVLTGNGGKIIRVNSGGTALEAASTGIAVSEGGTGAATLTGLLQGNGTSAITGITNSTTVGEVLRVTGSNTYAWGALNLADGDAITGDIPDGNLSANVPLLDASNTFTGVEQTITGASAGFILRETGGTADEGGWELRADSDALNVYTLADVGGAVRTVIGATRTGTNIGQVSIGHAGATTEIQLDATLLDFNGGADFSSFVRAAGYGAFQGAYTSGLTGLHVFLDSDGGTVPRVGGLTTGGLIAPLAIRSSTITIIDSTNTMASFNPAEVDLTATVLDLNGDLDADGATHDINGSTSTTLTGGSAVVTLSGTEVDLTATTLDLNGAADISGTLTVSGEDLTPATGTFSGNFTTACTTTPSGNYSYTRIGGIVVLQLEGTVSCTSDVTAFRLDAGSLPAAIRPADTQCVAIGTVNNDSPNYSGGIAEIQADGTIDYHRVGSNGICGGLGWTGSGTKSIAEHTVTYHLN